MNPCRPRISIGLPVFNGQRYLAQAIDSIRGQTVEDWELIISDNGSTDQTPYICREWVRRDRRIQYWRSPINRGATWNFNRVFRIARADYFKWAAYDDLIEPNFLDKCCNVLDEDASAVLSYTQVQLIDAEGGFIRRKSTCLPVDSADPALRLHAVLCQIPFEAVFGVIRGDVLASTGLLGDYANADIVLLAELALRGRMIEVPESLFHSRDHAGNSVRAHPAPTDRAVWFDPRAAGRITFPICREAMAYGAAINEAPLTVYERMRCWGQVARWVQWNRGRMARELNLNGRRYARQLFAAWRGEPTLPQATSN